MTGDDYLAVLNHARANGYAIPAVNCTMCHHQLVPRGEEGERARSSSSPTAVARMAGKGLKNEADQKAAVMGRRGRAARARARRVCASP